MTTVLWIAGICLAAGLLGYVALVIAFVERKRRSPADQVFRGGSSEETPLAEQEASSAFEATKRIGPAIAGYLKRASGRRM